jgi:hypothetical protein
VGEKRGTKRSAKGKKPPSGRKAKPAAAKRRKHASRRSSIIGEVGKAFTVLAAAPTLHVTVARTLAGGPRLDARLNDRRLAFDGADMAHAIVGQGQSNHLEWIVVGAPGSSYTIAVTEPPRTPCGDPSLNGATLDNSGRDGGSCDFDT